MKKYRIPIVVAVLLLAVLFKVEKQVYDLNGKKLGKFVGEQTNPDCPEDYINEAGDWVTTACNPVNNYVSGNVVNWISKQDSIIKYRAVLRFSK